MFSADHQASPGVDGKFVAPRTVKFAPGGDDDPVFPTLAPQGDNDEAGVVAAYPLGTR